MEFISIKKDIQDNNNREYWFWQIYCKSVRYLFIHTFMNLCTYIFTIIFVNEKIHMFMNVTVIVSNMFNMYVCTLQPNKCIQPFIINNIIFKCICWSISCFFVYFFYCIWVKCKTFFVLLKFSFTPFLVWFVCKNFCSFSRLFILIYVSVCDIFTSISLGLYFMCALLNVGCIYFSYFYRKQSVLWFLFMWDFLFLIFFCFHFIFQFL